MPEPLILGNRSMDTVRRPLCGCFVLSCMVGGIFRSPWVFDDASHLHDLKRQSLFRRDEVPARNTHKIVRLRLYAPKKVFRGSKGRFFKNAPLAGSGTESHRELESLSDRTRLCRQDEVLSRNAHRPSGFAFTHQKKFLRVPRGVFSKTHLGREWDRVPQKESEPAQRGAPFQAGRSPTKRGQV